MLLGKLVLSQKLDTLYSFSNYYSNSFQMHGVGQKSHVWAPWKCLFEKFLFFFFFMFCFLCLRHNLILLVGGRGSSWDTCQTLWFVAGSCNQRCPCWIPCGSVRQQSVNASLGGYEGELLLSQAWVFQGVWWLGAPFGSIPKLPSYFQGYFWCCVWP